MTCSIGRYVVFMLCEAVLFFGLVLAIELKVFRFINLAFSSSSVRTEAFLILESMINTCIKFPFFLSTPECGSLKSFRCSEHLCVSVRRTSMLSMNANVFLNVSLFSIVNENVLYLCMSNFVFHSFVRLVIHGPEYAANPMNMRLKPIGKTSFVNYQYKEDVLLVENLRKTFKPMIKLWYALLMRCMCLSNSPILIRCKPHSNSTI